MLAALLLVACVTPPPVMQPQLASQAAFAQPPGDDHAVWPAAQWWKGFADPQLDALIAEALRSSPGLNTARARIKAAEAEAAMTVADAGGRISAGGGYSRQRLSNSGLISGPLIGHNWISQADAGVSFDLDFDWWGKQHAKIAASLDRAHAETAEQQEAELVLVTAISANYFAWQTYDRCLRAGRDLAGNLDQQRAALAQRVGLGVDSAELLDRLDMERGQAGADLASLEADRFLRVLALSSLLGLPPEQLKLAPAPVKVGTVGVPANAGLGLIARRPDIVASRWRVEAAVQDVAQARAGYYPDIQLSALAGLATISPAQFFNYGSRVGSLGAAVYLPIFDMRRVKARHGQNQAQLDLAVAQYNEAVAAAAADVTRQLYARRGYTMRQEALNRRWMAAQQSRDKVAARYAAGLEDSAARLAADAEVLRANIALLQADADLVGVNLDLIKALGGGVQNTTVAAVTQSRQAGVLR